MILELLRLALMITAAVFAFRGRFRVALLLAVVCAYVPIAVLLASAPPGGEASLLLPFGSLLRDRWLVAFLVQMPLYLAGYGLSTRRLQALASENDTTRRPLVITGRCFAGLAALELVRVVLRALASVALGPFG